MRVLFCSIFFLLSTLSGFGQASDSARKDRSVPAWRVGVRGHYGFIMPHRRGMRHLVKGHIRSGALVLERPTRGAKEWQSEYMRPSWGLTLVYTDLGNPEMLGKGIAFFPYLDFPLWRKGRGGLFFRAGSGFGWIEKPFDRLENPKNIAIGSQGNITFDFMLHAKLGLPGPWSISAGFSFDHFSNMAVQMPNLGINLPSLQLGLFRGLGPPRELKEQKGAPRSLDLDKRGMREDEPPWRYSLAIAGGVKGVAPPNGRLFPALSLMGFVGRDISAKSQLGVGPDIEWNSSLRYLISEERSEGKELPVTHDGRIGVKAAYALVIGRLRLIGQWGVYLHNEYGEQGPFYHRFGVRYDLRRWVINGTLKTHFAKADHFELGIGYRLGGE